MTTTTKRKVELITLDSPEDSNKIPKTRNADNGHKYSNYLLLSDENTEQNKKINTCAQAYINKFVDNVKRFQVDFSKFSSRIEMFIKAIEEIRDKSPNFLTHTTFANLIDSSMDKIEKSSQLNSIFESNSDLILELKRIVRPVQQNDVPRMNEDKLRKKVAKLTKAIRKMQEQIAELENSELSLEDMNKKSVYTQIPVLRNSLVKCWTKREQLLERSSWTGRRLFKEFSYKGTSNAKVNEIITKYFNKYLNRIKHTEDKILTLEKSKDSKSKKSNKEEKFAFFSIMDLKNHLIKEIEEAKLDFSLTDETLTKVYENLLKENKNRRLEEQFEVFNTYENLTENGDLADEKDPDFIRQMNENDEKSKKSFEKIENDYLKLDHKKYGKKLEVGKQLGWDDKESEHSSSEDDEEEEDEENDDEQEKEKDVKSVKNAPKQSDDDKEIISISDDDD